MTDLNTAKTIFFNSTEYEQQWYQDRIEKRAAIIRQEKQQIADKTNKIWEESTDKIHSILRDYYDFKDMLQVRILSKKQFRELEKEDIMNLFYELTEND